MADFLVYCSHITTIAGYERYVPVPWFYCYAINLCPVLDTFEEPPSVDSVPESHSVDKEEIQNTSSSSSDGSSDAEGKEDGKRSSEASESIDKDKVVKGDTEIKPEKRPVAKKKDPGRIK